MTEATTAKCPHCGRRTATHAAGKDRWFCHFDKMEFEAIDDGDVAYGSPSRRLEREERRKQNQKQGRKPRGRWSPYPSADEGD